MRRLAPTLLALAALALPASALGANASITIDSTGYSDTSVDIKPGEQVTFTNNAPLTDDVRFEDESSARCGGLIVDRCSRTFTTAGQYRFWDQLHGCGAYATCADAYRGIVVVDGPPAVTSLSASPGAVRGQNATFSAAASDPNGDTIRSFNWNFGDGTTATTATGAVQHAYTSAGHFIASLTVTDSRGNVSGTSTTPIDVAVPDSDGDGLNDDLDKCASVAAATPDGCPIIPSVIPPKIVTSATAAKALGLAGAIKSGVNAVLTCSDTCSGVFTITRSGQASATGRVIATATVAITGAGSKVVTLKFTRSTQRSLARSKSARLLLEVVVTDALGRVQTDRASIALKPVKKLGKLPAIGISDQQAATFTDPLFKVLKLRYARLMTPWNGIFTEPERLDAWLQAARADGIRPLVSFERSRGDQCPRKPCKAPSKRQYTRAWKAFHKKYRWVKDISPWNEINSATQPTGKRPDLAATYYNIVRASCRGCTIVAADLLDASNIRRYVAAFLKKAKGKPRLWGLHNYTDTNRFRSRGTNALMQTVKGAIWLTETGGVVKFTTQSGKVALPKSEKRAKKAMDYMFKLAELNAKRIKRIYVYQWKINNLFDRFDAGIVRPDGTPRPSFTVLSLKASIARKR